MPTHKLTAANLTPYHCMLTCYAQELVDPRQARAGVGKLALARHIVATQVGGSAGTLRANCKLDKNRKLLIGS
jgi:hypothetical protein